MNKRKRREVLALKYAQDEGQGDEEEPDDNEEFYDEDERDPTGGGQTCTGQRW